MEQLSDQIKAHLQEVEAFNATEADALEAFRIKFLGKKGVLNGLFSAFKEVPSDQAHHFFCKNKKSTSS